MHQKDLEEVFHLTINYKLDPEWDRDNQHNENEGRKAVFVSKNRELMKAWRNKINEAVAVNQIQVRSNENIDIN